MYQEHTRASQGTRQPTATWRHTVERLEETPTCGVHDGFGSAEVGQVKSRGSTVGHSKTSDHQIRGTHGHSLYSEASTTQHSGSRPQFAADDQENEAVVNWNVRRNRKESPCAALSTWVSSRAQQGSACGRSGPRWNPCGSRGPKARKCQPLSRETGDAPPISTGQRLGLFARGLPRQDTKPYGQWLVSTLVLFFAPCKWTPFFLWCSL